MKVLKEQMLAHVFEKYEILKVPAICALLIGVPFFIHMIPVEMQKPLGALLLPLFFTALIASYHCALYAVFLACLVTPYLNHLFMQMPEITTILPLTATLCLFICLVYVFRSKHILAYMSGPLAYVCAAVFVHSYSAFFKHISLYEISSMTGAHLKSAWPGILILAIISYVFTRTTACER